MTHSTALTLFSDDVFSDAELRTLAGFLGDYSGLTPDVYALDLRQFAPSTYGCRTYGPTDGPWPSRSLFC